jgi:hypothetical protein
MSDSFSLATPRLDAIVPLAARDLERFQLLRRSLETHAPEITRCFVVVPDHEQFVLQKAIDGTRFTVLPESELLPGLPFWQQLFARFGKRMPGWFLQQLIKLAAPAVVSTPFYLTLDADVVCRNPIPWSTWFVEGKAIVQTLSESVFPQWDRGSAKALGMPLAARIHGVTPALLATDGVRRLQAFLARRQSVLWRLVAQLSPLRHTAGWQSFLMPRRSWTEYTLYYTFLYGTRLFEQYHFPGTETAIYDTQRSFWLPEHLNDETRSGPLAPDAAFIVIQSNCTTLDQAHLLASSLPALR